MTGCGLWKSSLNQRALKNVSGTKKSQNGHGLDEHEGFIRYFISAF